MALRAAGAELVEFAPHDLEDVFELCRRVGGQLVGTANALRFETELARPLAQIGGSSFGLARPRVIAVVGLDPLELAGGHSFETDLIEIAGGRSLTHGGDEPRLALRSEQLAEYAPDLILVVVSPVELTPAEQRAAHDALPGDARVELEARR
jgi:ABC-type Fe3+-hydroxamate transport system substrate-binding protein